MQGLADAVEGRGARAWVDLASDLHELLERLALDPGGLAQTLAGARGAELRVNFAEPFGRIEQRLRLVRVVQTQAVDHRRRLGRALLPLDVRRNLGLPGRLEFGGELVATGREVLRGSAIELIQSPLDLVMTVGDVRMGSTSAAGCWRPRSSPATGGSGDVLAVPSKRGRRGQRLVAEQVAEEASPVRFDVDAEAVEDPSLLPSPQ